MITKVEFYNNKNGIRIIIPMNFDIDTDSLPLYETHFSDNGNSESLDYRYQNDVIKDIYNALEKEKKKAEESDKMVDDFFAKLGLKEG